MTLNNKEGLIPVPLVDLLSLPPMGTKEEDYKRGMVVDLMTVNLGSSDAGLLLFVIDDVDKVKNKESLGYSNIKRFLNPSRFGFSKFRLAMLPSPQKEKLAKGLNWDLEKREFIKDQSSETDQE